MALAWRTGAAIYGRTRAVCEGCLRGWSSNELIGVAMVVTCWLQHAINSFAGDAKSQNPPGGKSENKKEKKTEERLVFLLKKKKSRKALHQRSPNLMFSPV